MKEVVPQQKRSSCLCKRFIFFKQKLQSYKEKLEKKEKDLKSLRVFNINCLIRDIFTLSVREVYPQFGTPPRSTYITQSMQLFALLFSYILRTALCIRLNNF